MRNFKGADFGKWMSNQEQTKVLLAELKEFLSRPLESPTGRSLATQQRLACDGILRACNQQVVAGLASPEHLSSLLELVEMACDGYLTATPHRSPLYLERILFVLLRNISAQVSPKAVHRLIQSLHACLVQHVPVTTNQDYETIARGAFSLLWKRADAAEDQHSAFSVRLWALSFLVLLENESTPCKFPHFSSPTACQAEAACRLFEANGHPLSEADTCFLNEQLSTRVIKVLVGEEAGPSCALSPRRALCLLELTLERCRRLCLHRCCDEATRAVQEAQGYLGNTDLAPSLQLCQLGVELQRLLPGALGVVGELLSKAAATLDFGVQGPSSSLRALSEACQFIFSVLENDTLKKHDSDTVLGFSAFLGKYCHLLRQLRDNPPVDCPKQQQVLTQMHFHGFQLYTKMVYDFFNGSKITELTDLTQLGESCRHAVVWMLEALEGLKDQEQTEYLGITACCTSHLAYRFYSQKLYAEASSVTEPFCQKMGLAKPGTYSGLLPERLHKCFRLHVESLKRLGQLAQGCKMVVLWLMALRPHTVEQMAEPIGFWIRVKMDAAKVGDKELQLKTLRDSLTGWSPEVLTPLLVEELRGYKAVRADTAQERFNIICDLLELSTEETPAGAWARATHLVELAQVLCYYDFAQHADCSALDAVQEALKLLESVQPESQVTDQFLDDKAQALLWLYICTLEAKMQKGIEQDLRTKSQPNLIELETNDLNYEDKIQNDHFLYSSLAFNLAADTAHSKCLDQALALWKKMLTKGQVPMVRCLPQTTSSLQILAALCQMLGKPLQALETYLLLHTLSENLKDYIRAASASCHITRILLTLDCPSYAQVYLKEAESSLQLSDHSSDGYLLLSQTCVLLRSQLYYIHKKVAEGLSLLLSVLRDSALQKPSKAWYLLRVQAMQLVAVYLSLPSSSLSVQQWEQLYSQGWQTSEIALIESHKLLRSIIILLMGRDVLSLQRTAGETVFLDYGENLIQKWLVLAEVLGCSEKLVTLLGRLGTVSEAKAFCLEALRLTLKLQCLRRCALFLVLKGELELARNDLDLCHSDLEQVLFLLQSDTEFEGITQPRDKAKKIHPQKGQQQSQVLSCSELLEEEPFLKGPALQLVATVDKDPGPSISSPVLKTKPQPCPAFLSHLSACNCTLCTDPALLAVCLRWLLASAGVEFSSGNRAKGLDLLQSVLKRCPEATDCLAQVLQAILSQEVPPSPAPRFLEDLIAQAYTRLALEGINHPPTKGLWAILETGLNFVASRTPHLDHWHASLLVAKALASISNLSCFTTQLFGNTWPWQPPVGKLSQTSKSSKNQSQKLTEEKSKQMVSNDPSLHSTSLESLDEKLPAVLRPMGRPCTPKQPGPAGPHMPFTVFDEELSVQSKPELMKAPRVRCRTQTRLKVNFSDDEDSIPSVRLAEKPKRGRAASRGRGRGRGSRVSRLKTNNKGAPAGFKDQFTSGSHSRKATVEEHVPQRALRRQTKLDVEFMRTIREEHKTDQLDMSFEILQDSDEEGMVSGGQKWMPLWHEIAEGECEVVRRDAGKEVPSVLAPEKRESHKQRGTRSRLVSAPATFGFSTLDSVYESLSTAFRCISHCPPSGLHAQLCRLLALCVGSRDPYATAFFVTESVSITSRHQLLTSLHRQLHKAQKQQTVDLTEQFQGLNLQEEPKGVPFNRLQHLFSFRTPRPGCFPQPEKESFLELLAQIPSGVTVCVLALVSLQNGTVGDTLLLTRLEKNTPPVTIQIPTAQTKMPLSLALGEFDAIQKEQKENSSCTEKSKWWATRLKLDRRMEDLITSLEKHILGCWKMMLVPFTGNPSLTQEASSLKDSLGQCGWKSPDPTLLQVVLGAAHTLSPQDVQALANGLCQAQPEKAQELLQEAIERWKGQTGESNGHLVLVLDKDLQKLPWENIPSLRAQPVTRLPSLRFLLSYSLIRETQASSVLNRGVNPQNTFYILNPQNNLGGTEDRFRARFCSEAGWKGLVGEAPSQEQVQAALTEHDLYIYAGHGAGASFLDGQTIQRLSCRAVALLFGCSSAALAVHGNLEGAGIVLKYMIAGCPLFLGNLWDVTDREIDRYTEALLQGWLEAGSGAPLLSYIIQARQAPRLKYLIGAAPVAYGLPVSLQ
ncbi:separin isoform X1 [Sarcophilus harrisii]|nr:separin isoform X1 [Sarcophilus harrisii]XP_023361223.1 separin isoform X1 [Sarcophilus harrisii]XP_023361224.1 separin isoform X1 [Sarcophilus harrisii]XP_023361225.1 separin isoform X1 [Sarcophilus harrisii]XP_031793662.1 separin isoform X1 [Sarcophilus harrisii]